MAGEGPQVRQRETTSNTGTVDGAVIPEKTRSTQLPSSSSSATPVSSCGAKRRRQEWAHYAELSTFEFVFYLCCATGSVLYVCYRVFRLSPTAFRMYADHGALRKGEDPLFERPNSFWRRVGPVRDSTNHEWSVILWLLMNVWPSYVVHLLLSALLRRFRCSTRLRLFLLGMWCVFSCARVVGFRVIASNFAYAFTGLVLAKLTNRVISLWALSVFGLTLLNFPDGVPYLRGFSAFQVVFKDRNFHYESYFIWVITLAHTFNRTTSFCHEMLKKNFPDAETEGVPRSFLHLTVDLFNYIYYLPIMVTGPLMTYDQFEDNLRYDSADFRRDHPGLETPTHLRISLDKENLIVVAKFIFNLLRLMFWLGLSELIVHRMYFGVLLKKPEFLRGATDLWELAGIGYCSGQFFYLKYLQMYGIHSLIAHLDGMTPPKQPKCITRVYLYSDMFRNFDTGLYNFIKRHLYIPLGGSHHGFGRQLLTSAIVYAFIYFWHGAELYIVLWTVVNFTTINLETAGRLLSKTTWVKSLATQLGPRMWRRLRVALATPLFLASTVAIFMFIGSNEEVLYIYWQRFFVEGVRSGGLFLTAFFMYTIAQCSVSFFKKEEKHLDDIDKTA